MRRVVLMGGFVAAVIFGPTAGIAGQAQPPQAKPAPAKAGSPIDGRWEGTVVTPEGAAAAIAELRMDGTAIKGSMTAGPYNVAVTGGSIQGETVTLAIDVNGMIGTMTATLKDDVLVGSWMVEGDSGPFSLKKASAAPAAEAAKPAEGATPAAGSDSISGEWDAVADAGGSQHPFTFTIKLDGEKVTGTISGEQGGGPLEGTFKDNTLTFTTSMPDGTRVTMTAALTDGKLTGTFDMGGQFQSGWTATKRK